MWYSKTVLLVFFLFSGTHANVQDDWVVPSNPDESTNVTNGESMTIAWASHLQTWFPTYCSKCDDTNVNLWIMGGNIEIKIAGLLSQIDKRCRSERQQM